MPGNKMGCNQSASLIVEKSAPQASEQIFSSNAKIWLPARHNFCFRSAGNKECVGNYFVRILRPNESAPLACGIKFAGGLKTFEKIFRGIIGSDKLVKKPEVNGVVQQTVPQSMEFKEYIEDFSAFLSSLGFRLNGSSFVEIVTSNPATSISGEMMSAFSPENDKREGPCVSMLIVLGKMQTCEGGEMIFENPSNHKIVHIPIEECTSKNVNLDLDIYVFRGDVKFAVTMPTLGGIMYIRIVAFLEQ